MGPQVEVDDDTERVGSTTESPEDFAVLGLAGLYEGTVGKDDINGNNVVKSNTPVAASVAVATVSEVTTNTNARAGSVGDGTLALVPNTLGEVAETDTATNFGDVIGELDVLEWLQIDDWIMSEWWRVHVCEGAYRENHPCHPS